jgi:hypothetical protein
MALDPLFTFKNLKSFKRDLWGDEFAHCIARITIGWGNIEYRLFWLLYAIDMKRAADWAALLFVPPMLEPRKQIVRKQIAAVTKSSYPKFVDYLEDQFTKLQAIQKRRNLLAHGFWFEGSSDQVFKVQPLNIKKGTKALEEAVEVGIHFLSDLIQDMDFLEQGLASLSSEMMSHQQLKKWGKR